MIQVIGNLITLVIAFLVLGALLTWIPDTPGSPLSKVRAFYFKFTVPIYGPVRRLIPPIQGRLDISPMIVIFGLLVIRNVVFSFG